MIHSLDEKHYARALPILDGVEHALALNAVLEGTCPGEVHVDNPDAPRAVFASTPEGHYVVGDSMNEEFRASLQEFITSTVLPDGQAAGWWYFSLHYWPNGWRDALRAMFDPAHVVEESQKFYRLQRPSVDWREGMPSDCHMEHIDEPLLGRAELANVEKLQRWARSNFGSVEGFVKNGFGSCLVKDDDIVSWCMSDCVSGHRCEIGIHTDHRHRRRGLATLTTAATIEHCLSRGLTHVGWHCHTYNRPSAATAEKVGFQYVLDHRMYRVWFNEVDPLLVNGNIRLMRGEFARAAELYDRALCMAERAGPDPAGSRLLRDPRDAARHRYQAACAWALAGDERAARTSLGNAIDASCRQGAY